MSGLVQELFGGSLDVVGDIHGEIDALRNLLARLGYKDDGLTHPDGRRLVFLGDLCDRGPDSVEVVKLVQKLVENKRAQCILGNHELNVLRADPKEGNRWILDPAHVENRELPSRTASSEEATTMVDFFKTLPIALESSLLRVVHAAWDDTAIDAMRSSRETNIETFLRHEHATEAELRKLREEAKKERAPYADKMTDATFAMPLLKKVGIYEEKKQTLNPVRRLTSGPEQAATEVFFASGQWRFADRVKWWDTYHDERDVIFGHYWRGNRSSPDLSGGKPDVFAGHEPGDWLGPKRNVYCVDFSVGARFKERKKGKGTAAAPFATKLGAVRWPERSVVFDDGSSFPSAKR